MIKAKTNKSTIDLTNKSLSIAKVKVLDPKLGLIHEYVLYAKHKEDRLNKDAKKTDVIRLNRVTCILASNDKDGEKEFFFTNGYEVGSKDWVNNRTKVITEALKYHEGICKDQGIKNDDNGSVNGDENPPTTQNTENITQDPSATQGTETNTQEPVTDAINEGQITEIKPAVVKFTNTTNDKVFSEEETTFKTGDNVLDIIKELATNENTSEKFKSMVISDEYKFSYWSIVNEDGSETKITKGSIIESEVITLKAHWKNK